jgi:hypothetical protein
MLRLAPRPNIKDLLWRPRRRPRLAAPPKGNRPCSQASNRDGEARAASSNAIEILEQDHPDVEEWFNEYAPLEDKDDDRKAELAEKVSWPRRSTPRLKKRFFIRKLVSRQKTMI